MQELEMRTEKVRPPTPEPILGAWKPVLFLAIVAILFYLALAIGYSITRAPWWDEGVFADVALNFRNYGHLGSSTLYSYGYLKFPEANRYTYWQFPVYLMTLGAWLRIVPTTIAWIRALSIIWGLVYLASWYGLIRSLSRSTNVALVVTSAVALDYAFLSAATDGRMDMMCSALGMAAIATYAGLRERDWNRAVLFAACFGAAALFCHPMGLLPNVSLALLMALDWRRIRSRGLLIAAIPYVIALLLCVWYVMQAPDVFLAQSKAASSYRVAGLQSFVRNLLNDAYLRYGGLYYFSLKGIDKLKGVLLIFPVVGTLALALNRKLLRQRIGQVPLILVVVGYLGVAAIDNQKFPIYFLYSLPAMTACGAVWAAYAWPSGRFRRWMSAFLVAVSMIGTAGGFTYKIYLDEYQNRYEPAIAAIRRAMPPYGLVMGGSELGFELGFGPQLVDDRYMGFFSGKQPDVYVANAYYGINGTGFFADATAALLKKLRDDYHLQFENEDYRVYVRNRR